MCLIDTAYWKTFHYTLMGFLRLKTVVIIENTEAPAPAEESAAGIEGSWYGWWKMVDTSGDWAHMHGYWWDCCAELCEDGSLLIWDEDLPRENYLAKLYYRPDGGQLALTGGSFMDRVLAPDEYSMLITEDKSGRLLTISGSYTAQNSEGGFRLEMFMRPWGSVWQVDENELPYYYTDWYLPLIEAGKPMPDSIGK